MLKTNNTINYSNSNQTIHLISSLTSSAQPNSEFEVRTHYNEFEIYYFLEGDLYFAFEGNRYNVQEGSMIFISNGTLHKPIIKSTCKYYRKRILFDRKIFVDSNIPTLDFYNILRKRKFIVIDPETVISSELNVLFDQLEQSLSQNITPYEDFCALILLFYLLIKIEKFSRENSTGHICSNNKKITEIVKYIDEHISDDLDYKTISKKFFVTEKYLYKLFKSETGFTLGGYINERRIIKAQHILNAGGTSKEASAVSGFKDYSVFYRSFLRKVGISPAKYIEDLTKNK